MGVLGEGVRKPQRRGRIHHSAICGGGTLVVASEKLYCFPENKREAICIKILFLILRKSGETSLVVQWLRLSAPNAGHLGSIPGQAIR